MGAGNTAPLSPMLVRVIKDNPGTVYKSGALVRISDKQAAFLIEQGFALPADEAQLDRPIEAKPRKSDNPFLLPPRFIHGCGYVAKSAEELEAHDKVCD